MKLRLTSDPSLLTVENALQMCPYDNTSSLQAFRIIVEVTTGMDVLNANFSKLEHSKIQLA